MTAGPRVGAEAAMLEFPSDQRYTDVRREPRPQRTTGHGRTLAWRSAWSRAAAVLAPTAIRFRRRQKRLVHFLRVRLRDTEVFYPVDEASGTTGTGSGLLPRKAEIAR